MGYEPTKAVILSLDLDGGLTPTVTGDLRSVSFAAPGGSHAFNYSGLEAFDAEGKALPAELELVDGRLEMRVEVGAGPWPVTVDPVISSETKLQGLHDDAEYDDRFGESVSVSGDTALVGADGDDDAGDWSGSAYVFVRYGGAWVLQAKLTASDAAASDYFGNGVSVDGDTALVGAHFEDGAGSIRGAAYVFVRSGSEWIEQAKLVAADAADDDRFGHSVAISGDTALVGAIRDDDGGSESGSAYVFLRSGAVWNLQQKLTAPDATSDDYFGWGVALAADTAVVGSPGSDSTVIAVTGAAYVFVRSGTTWTHQQKLTAPDGANYDAFGENVSMSGDTVLVGSAADDDAGNASGSAYVFVRSGTTWSQQAKLTASDAAADDSFGDSVSVSGDIALVGAYFDTDVASHSGSAYVFVRSGTVWTQQQKLTASDASAIDYFGAGVGVSGDTALVGALFGDSGAVDGGAAYAFVRSGTTWSEHTKLTAVVTQPGHDFGMSVSIEGDVALVGASDDLEGTLSLGAAYVFVRSGEIWTRQAKLTASDAEEFDGFGNSVSLSGVTALIGARQHDHVGTAAGAAFVFVRSGNTWSQQAELRASDATDADFFGESVSITGDTALVGADGDDDAGDWSGSAYVFVRSGASWSQQAKLTASDAALGDQFGENVSVSGDTALVGAMENEGGGPSSGAAYVFVRSGSTWSQEAKLVASDAASSPYLGGSVSVSGDTALVGAPYDNSGSAYVFVRSGTSWKERQKLTASDAVGPGHFGYSVSVSGDSFFVGAPHGYHPGDGEGTAYVFVRAGTGWLESAKLAASDGANSVPFGVSISASGDTALVGAHDYNWGTKAGSAYVYRFECGIGGGIAPGRWGMIGIPCDLGAADTVQDVFGDNLVPADYGLTWIIYRRDETTDAYVPLTLSSSLEQGKGYWIYSEYWGVWDAIGAFTPWVQSGLCVSPKGCYEVALTPPDSSATHRWNLVGHPGNQTSNWSGVAVIVDGTRYNSPSEAEDAGYVSKTIHKYTGTAYESSDDITPGMEAMLESQEGFWVEMLGDSSGHAVSLLIPDGMAPGAPPGPPGLPEADPVEIGEWYLRLIAETPAEGLIDRGNVLGQVLDSSDGYDPHDLFELAPFADPHLTIVFPHDDWGERAGDYTSDYHPSAGELDDEWVFEVWSDSPWRDVRLAWGTPKVLEGEDPPDGSPRQWTVSSTIGGEALMETMWLEDLSTGALVKVAEDGVPQDYLFNMNGETVRSFRWFAELSTVNLIFADGFEFGDTEAWSEVTP